jgi:rSAM/selenodomain-associated transferase 2
MISLIIPTYNESATIEDALTAIFELISPEDEVIVVDGLSEDNTREIVSAFPHAKLLISRRGRAVQMNLGVEKAINEYILFLHADTSVSANCINNLKNQITLNGAEWGWFPIRLNSPKLVFRIMEIGANLRTMLTGTPLGDHGIFVRKDVFLRVGGFPEISLMEDLEFVRRVKRVSKGVEIRPPIQTSVRRFEKSGILKTFITMWVLRILYYLGTSPETLARYYDHIR